MSETLKRKRVAFEMKHKQEIIEKYNGGTKPKELSILFNVSPSTICQQKSREDSKTRREQVKEKSCVKFYRSRATS